MYLPWHIYREAEEDGVEVHFMRFRRQASMSMPGHIAIDTSKLPTTAEECTAAVHELSHDCTGSYYMVNSSLEERRRSENRADKYAIRRFIKPEELRAAMESGLTEYWQLAEYFGFTEDFIRKAVCYYENGNLNLEQPPSL